MAEAARVGRLDVLTVAAIEIGGVAWATAPLMWFGLEPHTIVVAIAAATVAGWVAARVTPTIDPLEAAAGAVVAIFLGGGLGYPSVPSIASSVGWLAVAVAAVVGAAGAYVGARTRGAGEPPFALAAGAITLAAGALVGLAPVGWFVHLALTATLGAVAAAALLPAATPQQVGYGGVLVTLTVGIGPGIWLGPSVLLVVVVAAFLVGAWMYAVAAAVDRGRRRRPAAPELPAARVRSE